MPLYHPECQVFEVKDRDSSLIGILYMDFFPRASKKGGAWMNNYRDQYHYDGQKQTFDQLFPIPSIFRNLPVINLPC